MLFFTESLTKAAAEFTLDKILSFFQYNYNEFLIFTIANICLGYSAEVVQYSVRDNFVCALFSFDGRQIQGILETCMETLYSLIYSICEPTCHISAILL